MHRDIIFEEINAALSIPYAAIFSAHIRFHAERMMAS